MGEHVASVATDEGLVDRFRTGDDRAYAELFRRHEPMLRRFALSLRPSGIDVDDVVGEVFLRVLRAVRTGHGPTDYVRTYLLTVTRRVVSEWASAPRAESLDSARLGERVLPQGDHQTTQAEGELLALAFGSLPMRWREVLWRTEVEGHRPASIAARFGLTANATAVLACRARQGLRQAYFQASEPSVPGCGHRRRAR